MSDFQTNLEGYVLGTGVEGSGNRGSYGIKVFVKLGRDLTDEDQTTFYKAQDFLQAGLLKETIRLDPDTAKTAAVERAAITALFPCPIFVEEIPNGYCSQYCCAFKPWFVITTSVGRIKIGWRKSVINIDWSDSAIKGRASEIFPNEEAWPGYETTQGDKYIHAHGYGDAKKYIARLMVSA